MIGANTKPANVAHYELEISIDASPKKVWEALMNETNVWWLADFRMVSPDSTVTFDTQAGGGLIEHSNDGGSLLWYTVNLCQPKQRTIYLVGHIAPDWGGPSTSHLKLSVQAREDGGSLFQVSDGQHGNVDESSLNSLESGWRQLFTDGLKAHVEKS